MSQKFVRNYKELLETESFSYPGDTETFSVSAPLGKAYGFERIAINLEILKPGDRSSWPHAHKLEEEFVFVVEGNPQIWVDGTVYEMGPGDCVGFKPGTGHAHTLLNNSDGDVKVIVVGERNVKNEKAFYPMHPKRNEEIKKKGWLWEDAPKHQFGGHDGWPDLKRPK